jgi:hypothetical protein
MILFSITQASVLVAIAIMGHWTERPALFESYIDGFTATNVLTTPEEECVKCIKAVAEEAANFKWSSKRRGPKFSRNRICSKFTDTAIAEYLFAWLQPLLLPSVYHHSTKKHDHAFGGPNVPSGKYVYVGMNDKFCVSKYMPDGQFWLHKDTVYVCERQSIHWVLDPTSVLEP